ncbi:Rossmann-fold NAD(P)-binding domain-containing protein [Oleomonas cavernae]|uniref:hypothetical protein n=1 Tax=Oleomonas cavernae TaxID=2320859 RepID=UPI0018F70A25|nr:hypothetical protein [Oleomonas cavernae]
MEKELAGVGFASLTIVRPSGIDGERNPPRAMESLGMSIVRHLAPIIPRRYRVVTPTQIAKALIQGALATPPGVNIVESEAL